ncbi:MAG: type 4a pilus biogenesis protein PilO [Gemmatimonadaceae bacterium]|nr:type 4a pilus biogenesis protein PilO [Gemmatimonadaceae bacterium]
MAIGDNLTKREQTLVGISILAFVALGALWYFMLSPKSETLAALAARVDSLEAANQQAKTDVAQGSVDSLRAAVARDREALKIMTRLVPTRNEVPGLLEDVSTAARRVGLDLASVEPMPVIPGDDFDTHRYKISVIGGYHELGRFLSNVGSLQRIVAPVALEMKPFVSSGSGAVRRPGPGKSMLDSNFQIQTYVARLRPDDPLATRASDAEVVAQ